jgi:hypothetical protein
MTTNKTPPCGGFYSYEELHFSHDSITLFFSTIGCRHIGQFST